MKIELLTKDGEWLATVDVPWDEGYVDLIFWHSRFFVPDRDENDELKDSKCYVETQAHVVA